MKRLYRLPYTKEDGTNTTHDPNEFGAAWDAIAKPLEAKFGWELHGCGPDLHFLDQHRHLFVLTVAAARDILAAVTT